MTKKRKKRARLKTGKRGARLQDSLISPSGAGSKADRGRGYEPVGKRYGSETRDGRGRRYGDQAQYSFYFRLWRDYWEAQKIVDIPPYDMTREGWEYVNTVVKSELIKKIEQEAVRVKLLKTIRRALHFERLYGGAAVILGTKGLEDEKADEPLTVAGLGSGDLVFLRAMPRWEITPTDYEQNPLSENYQNPECYTIRSKKIHRSRLLIFDGGGDPGEGLMLGRDSVQMRMDGFGYSV